MTYDKRFAIIDDGLDFLIGTTHNEIDIKYGNFALCLINTNYDKMNNLVTKFIQNNHFLQVAEDLQDKYKEDRIKPPIIDPILNPLHYPMKEFLAQDYLTNSQAEAITYLLLHEIKLNFVDNIVDLQNPLRYIPSIFSDKALHSHIRNSLLKKTSSFTDDLQYKMSEIEIATSAMIVSSGKPITIHYPHDTLSYLILDLHKYLMSKECVNECKYCGRLFYPKYRNSELYCRLPHSDTILTCNQIMHRNVNDEFAKLRNTARGYQHNRCYNESTQKQYSKELLDKLYTEWSNECGEKYFEFKAKNDLKGFRDWIETTKFTSSRLKSMHP